MRRRTVLFLILIVVLGLVLFSGNNRTRLERNVQSDPGEPQTDPVKAAALYAGMVTGMAIVCKLDTEPVVQSYKAFLERHKAALLAEDQQALLNLNAQGMGMGMRMQKERGAMPCSEVGDRMREAISWQASHCVADSLVLVGGCVAAPRQERAPAPAPCPKPSPLHIR